MAMEETKVEAKQRAEEGGVVTAGAEMAAAVRKTARAAVAGGLAALTAQGQGQAMDPATHTSSRRTRRLSSRMLGRLSREQGPRGWWSASSSCRGARWCGLRP